ncbi:MAG: hypothetical protein V4506_08965 [Bacteroidota bacterium]
MTDIQVIKIENGAEYDGMVWDFWITARLKNQAEIQIFDPKGLNLNEYVGKWVQVKLSSLFVGIEKEEGLIELDGMVTMQEDRYLFTNSEIEIYVAELEFIPLNTFRKFYFGRVDVKQLSN